jgi:hypothetical protein
MRAIYPKFLGKKAELFGLEMRDIFTCMGLIGVLKLIDSADLIVIAIPGIYLSSKFILNLFFPRFHIFFLARRKRFFEWTRYKKGK